MELHAEDWLLVAGDRVIQKRAIAGYSSLSPIERLTYCLWVADYGMRNAGDLITATDLHPTFLNDARTAARELGLAQSSAAFSLSITELQRTYFDLFEVVVRELVDATDT